MANQSQRGGMKQPASQTGTEKKHQGVHPDSTTQSEAKDVKQTGSQNRTGRDPHEGEQVVPKKETHESEK